MADIGQLLLIHVLQEEILRVGGVIRRVGVDVPEVVGEGTDVVVVVLGPTSEVLTGELTIRPGLREGRVLGLAAFDGILERSAEVLLVQQLGHVLCSPVGSGRASADRQLV